jgi:hypothetical protein
MPNCPYEASFFFAALWVLWIVPFHWEVYNAFSSSFLNYRFIELGVCSDHISTLLHAVVEELGSIAPVRMHGVEASDSSMAATID